MTIVGIDIGSSDYTVDQSNFDADAGDSLSLNVLGSHTLIIDGVNATASISSSVQVTGASPTYSVINGGGLTIDSGAADLSNVGSLNYEVSDGSSIHIIAPTDAVGIVNEQNLNFTGNGGGSFSYDPGDVSLQVPTTFNVTSLGVGDSLSAGTRTNGAFTYDAQSNVGTLIYPGSILDGRESVRFNIEGLSQEDYDTIIANHGGAASGFGEFISPVCFLRGTMILTPNGEVAIESLVPGDKVIAGSGVRDVKWVGFRKTFTNRIHADHRAEHMPIRIVRNAIAENVPSKDIVVSPGHHILFEGKLIRAKDIVNGKTIYQETHHVSYEYLHVELDQFDVISAHGLMSESWADGGNRDYFQNAEVTSLRAEDRERRKADRPGFDALRKAKDIAPLHAQLAKRADEIVTVDAQVKAA